MDDQGVVCCDGPLAYEGGRRARHDASLKEQFFNVHRGKWMSCVFCSLSPDARDSSCPDTCAKICLCRLLFLAYQGGLILGLDLNLYSALV